MKLQYYLSGSAELRSLYESVEEDYSANGLIHHNWHHVLRDLARAVLIGEAEKADMKLLLSAVLLRDIGRLHPISGKDHYESGTVKAREHLVHAGFTDEEVGRILDCIRASGPRGLKEPETTEEKVVYDVDVLSCSVGCRGVARVFDFFMRESNIGVMEMLAIPSDMKGPRRDFYTGTGEALGKEGLDKARRFWRELRQELDEEVKVVREVIPEYEGD
jgi:HD superfamily phosphodiesterase